MRKELSFCAKAEIGVLGIVENMAGFLPLRPASTRPNTGGAKQLAADSGFELLGRLPVDSKLTRAAERGVSLAAAGTGSSAAAGRSVLRRRIPGRFAATAGADPPNVRRPVAERRAAKTGLIGCLCVLRAQGRSGRRRRRARRWRKPRPRATRHSDSPRPSSPANAPPEPEPALSAGPLAATAPHANRWTPAEGKAKKEDTAEDLEMGRLRALADSARAQVLSERERRQRAEGEGRRRRRHGRRAQAAAAAATAEAEAARGQAELVAKAAAGVGLAVAALLALGLWRQLRSSQSSHILML